MTTNIYTIPAGHKLLDLIPTMDGLNTHFFVKKEGGQLQPGEVVTTDTEVTVLPKAKGG